MFKLTGNSGKKLSNSQGLVQIPIMIGLVIMAITLPLVANLVQKNTENRSKAVELPAKEYELCSASGKLGKTCATGLICISSGGLATKCAKEINAGAGDFCTKKTDDSINCGPNLFCNNVDKLYGSAPVCDVKRNYKSVCSGNDWCASGSCSTKICSDGNCVANGGVCWADMKSLDNDATCGSFSTAEFIYTTVDGTCGRLNQLCCKITAAPSTSTCSYKNGTALDGEKTCGGQGNENKLVVCKNGSWYVEKECPGGCINGTKDCKPVIDSSAKTGSDGGLFSPTANTTCPYTKKAGVDGSVDCFKGTSCDAINKIDPNSDWTYTTNTSLAGKTCLTSNAVCCMINTKTAPAPVVVNPAKTGSDQGCANLGGTCKMTSDCKTGNIITDGGLCTTNPNSSYQCCLPPKSTSGGSTTTPRLYYCSDKNGPPTCVGSEETNEKVDILGDNVLKQVWWGSEKTACDTACDNAFTCDARCFDKDEAGSTTCAQFTDEKHVQYDKGNGYCPRNGACCNITDKTVATETTTTKSTTTTTCSAPVSCGKDFDTYKAKGDFNCDRDIGINDFLTWKGLYNQKGCNLVKPDDFQNWEDHYSIDN